MHTSSLKQRLIKDDPDDSRLSRAKIEDYSEKHIPLIPPQDGDWVSLRFSSNLSEIHGIKIYRGSYIKPNLRHDMQCLFCFYY